MKKLIAILMVAALTVGTFTMTGCKTTSNPSGLIVVGNVTIDPAATGVAVQIAAKLGTVATMNAKPESRQYFAIAADVVAAAIASGNYDPANLKQTITATTGNDLAANSIADALALYEAMFSQMVVAGLGNKSPYAVPVLTGLAQGMRDGVALTAAKSGEYQPVPATPVPVQTKAIKLNK